MICFLSLELIHKNSNLYHKTVKFMINTSNTLKIIFNIVICYYELLNFIIINSKFFFYFKIWHYSIIFQILDIAILLYSIYKTGSYIKKKIVS